MFMETSLTDVQSNPEFIFQSADTQEGKTP